MTDFRINFSKTGPMVYISHLDLTHAFIRAFHRAEIPLCYSSGFNPHPKLVFALPLPVGMAGENELCEVKCAKDFSPEELQARLSGTLPPHLRILSVGASEGKFKNTVSADYRFTLPAVHGKADAIRAFFEQASIEVVKKTKSGEHRVNIRPQIFSVRVCEQAENAQESVISAPKPGAGGGTTIFICADASPDGYLNPEYALRALTDAGVLSAAESDYGCARTRIHFR